MPGENEQEKGSSPKKIKIGRLHIDPIFLLLFMFFAATGFLLLFYLWLAS